MKSILRQLKKYQSPSVPVEIKVESHDDSRAALLEELAKRITSLADISFHWPGSEKAEASYLASKAKSVARLLKDMPNCQYVSVLYPIEVLAIYHCFYNHQVMAASETATDHWLRRFLESQDMAKFREMFEEAADETVKRITLTRVAQATYEFGKPLDCLPVDKFRKPAEDYLGVRGLAAVAGLQEKLTKSASIEQIILGRIGYLMLWYWHNSNPKAIGNVPLLGCD